MHRWPSEGRPPAAAGLWRSYSRTRRAAAAAAALALLLLAWRVVLPRIVERRLCATLRARGFPDARLEVLSVGLGTIQLGRVELWPGAWVPRGRVEFSFMNLLEGRIDHVFLDGAEVAVPMTSNQPGAPGRDLSGDDLTSVLAPGGSMTVQAAHLHLSARGRQIDLVVNGSLTRTRAGAVWSGAGRAGSARDLAFAAGGDLAFAAGGVVTTRGRFRASILAGSTRRAGAGWAVGEARYEAGDAAGAPGRWRVAAAGSCAQPLTLEGTSTVGLAGWTRGEVHGGAVTLSAGGWARRVQVASLDLAAHRVEARVRGSMDLATGTVRAWLDGRAARVDQTSASLSIAHAHVRLPLGDRASGPNGSLTGRLSWHHRRLGRIRTALAWRAGELDLRGVLAADALGAARFALAGRVGVAAGHLRGSLHARLHRATLRLDRDSHLDRVSASLDLPDLSHPSRSGTQRLRFASGRLGSVPLGPGWVAATLRSDSLVLRAGARVGGGSIRTSRVVLRPNRARDIPLTLHGENLALAQLLPLLGSDVRGRGRVDGRLAVRLAPRWPPEVAIGEGSLTARGPGRLRIASPRTLARLAGDQTRHLGELVRARVLGALADFDFTRARARLARGARGGLHLTAELAGRGHTVPQELSLSLHVTGLDPLAQARFRTGALSMSWPAGAARSRR